VGAHHSKTLMILVRSLDRVVVPSTCLTTAKALPPSSRSGDQQTPTPTTTWTRNLHDENPYSSPTRDHTLHATNAASPSSMQAEPLHDSVLFSYQQNTILQNTSLPKGRRAKSLANAHLKRCNDPNAPSLHPHVPATPLPPSWRAKT
jgi:hypothetical protein